MNIESNKEVTQTKNGYFNLEIKTFTILYYLGNIFKYIIFNNILIFFFNIKNYISQKN
jgi:hypothetical protein